MQKRKRVASVSRTKLKRPHVVPNRQVRPQILRKVMRLFLHSGRFCIFVAIKKSMTAPELNTTANKPILMKKWANLLLSESNIQHLSKKKLN